MESPLVKSAVMAACGIVAQAATAFVSSLDESKAHKDRQEQEMKLWDVSKQEATIAFVDSLEEASVVDDWWWDRVAFQQPEPKFIRDFRMTKDRFFEVRPILCWLLA